MGKQNPVKDFSICRIQHHVSAHDCRTHCRYTDISESISRRSINTTRLGAGAELFIKGLSKKVLLADNLSALYTTLQASGTTSFVGTGLPLAHIHWSCISISADIPIWPSVLDKCWDSISTRTLIILTSPPASLNSGVAGIFLSEAGSVITSTSHWEATVFPQADTSATSLWYGHSPVSGMGASWNFVFWGVYYGLLLLAEKFLLGRFLEKAPVWLRNLYTMFAVIIGWVFFSQTTPAAIGKMLGAMFGLGASCFADRASLYALKSGLILMIISVISCRPGLYQYFKRLARRNTYLAAVINAILFFLCIAYMIYSSYTPFMYQQF